MTDRTPPASRPELVDQYRAALGRGDWQAMLAAKEQLAARAEYDVAMEIRRAQENLRRARTRLEAVQTERSVVKQALEDARERAPLAAEQAAATRARRQWCTLRRHGGATRYRRARTRCRPPRGGVVTRTISRRLPRRPSIGYSPQHMPVCSQA